MAQTYSIEFKEEACKRVQSGVPAAQVARELGVNVNTLYTWMSRFKKNTPPNHLWAVAISIRRPPSCTP